MFPRKIVVIVIMLFILLNTASADRIYHHEITVGKGGGYDYNTINDAIVAMNQKQPPLGPDTLGCIRVYAGTYEEHLNDYYYPDGHNLPAHCDLIGMGENAEDVVIRHTRLYGFGDINQAGVKGNGDNIISNLKTYNYGANQPGVNLADDSKLDNCIIYAKHGAVEGHKNLVVSRCNVSALYGSCIRAYGTFSISDCDLCPMIADPNLEIPAGIDVYLASGTIEDVRINGSGRSSYPHTGAGLFGVILQLGTADEVSLSDLEININLTSRYNPAGKGILRVCGILSGSMWYASSNYPGRAIVRDCTINVTGIENDNGTPGDPSDDGADIMVDGVCVRGGGTVEVLDCSRIKTKRISAGEQAAGAFLELWRNLFVNESPAVEFRKIYLTLRTLYVIINKSL